MEAHIGQRCRGQQCLELSRQVPLLKRRPDRAGEYEAAILPASAGCEPSFELARPVRPKRRYSDRRQCDRASAAGGLQLGDLDARLDHHERVSHRLQFLGEPGARLGRVGSPWRNPQDCSESPTFGDQRPSNGGIATKALNGSTNLQRPGVQIHIHPLQTERLTDPKPAAESHSHERLKRVLMAGIEQCPCPIGAEGPDLAAIRPRGID
jgi:hypothetical protein